MKLTFDDPVSLEEITSELGEMIEPGTIELSGTRVTAEGSDDLVEGTDRSLPGRKPRKALAARAGGPSGANIHCGASYGFGDADGSFFIQRKCKTKYAQWGYLLSPYIRSIVVGYVLERGMDWTNNTVRQGRNAPHTEPASYTFHGSWTPVVTGDTVRYNDVFSFRHNLGQAGGEGAVTTWGTLNFRAAG